MVELLVNPKKNMRRRRDRRGRFLKGGGGGRRRRRRRNPSNYGPTQRRTSYARRNPRVALYNPRRRRARRAYSRGRAGLAGMLRGLPDSLMESGALAVGFVVPTLLQNQYAPQFSGLTKYAVRGLGGFVVFKMLAGFVGRKFADPMAHGALAAAVVGAVAETAFKTKTFGLGVTDSAQTFQTTLAGYGAYVANPGYGAYVANPGYGRNLLPARIRGFGRHMSYGRHMTQPAGVY